MWPFKKKEIAPVKRAYSGASFGRLVADWVSTTTSQDAELRTSLVALRNRSRDLGRNNDYAKNFFRAVQNNVIGLGIPFQGQVKKQRGGTLDDKTNALIEAAWQKWSRKDSCHAAGLLGFSDIERLIIKSVAESGEVCVRFIYQKMGRSKVPLALELIESDMLDEQYNGVADNGNTIRMGVEINSWQRPVAYWFRNKHPGDYQPLQVKDNSFARIRVPASEIIHLYSVERLVQSRGVPWMASAIMRIHHMQGYEEAEIIAARASAALMGFVESPEGEPSSDDVQNGDKVTEFSPGIFKYLAPGEKVNVPSLQRPGGQFDPFMRLMLRGVAAGCGASYETISRDYSQSNYSSSRLALIDDRDNWRSIQKWMLSNFHQVVFEAWLDMAVLSGELNLRDYETNPDAYSAVKWMPRGWSWVDPAKEVQAYKDAVRSGFMTQADVVAQSGADIDELLVQRKREVDLADSYDLVFDTNPAQTNEKGIQQPSAGAEAFENGEDPEETPAAQGK